MASDLNHDEAFGIVKAETIDLIRKMCYFRFNNFLSRMTTKAQMSF